MNYEIKNLKIEELQETLNLVKRLFDEFEAPYYSQEGVESFYKFISYKNIIQKINENMKINVIKKDNKIIGMIAYTKEGHIALLFIDKEYHKKSLGTKLIEKAKQYYRNKGIESITVNSSPYAIEFYHKLKFIDTSKEQTVNGIIYTPMKLNMYSFRKYKEEYFEYLYQTKKDCFKWYVEKLYGEWNDEFQIEFFRNFINEELNDINVIVYQNREIGIFTNKIDKDNKSVIGLFYIDKKFQGRGIGKKILEEQLEKDRENGRDTILQVFKENPARFLYKKVGFEVYDETESHYKMIRKLNNNDI